MPNIRVPAVIHIILYLSEVVLLAVADQVRIKRIGLPSLATSEPPTIRVNPHLTSTPKERAFVVKHGWVHDRPRFIF